MTEQTDKILNVITTVKEGLEQPTIDRLQYIQMIREQFKDFTSEDYSLLIEVCHKLNLKEVRFILGAGIPLDTQIGILNKRRTLGLPISEKRGRKAKHIP